MSEKITKYFTKSPEEQEDRVIRFIGSTEDIDRDGDIMKADGWDLKNYKKNPVVLVNHMRSALPIARTKKVFINDKKQLVFDVEFPTPEVSADGDTLYRLAKGGFMPATSVSFMPDMDKVEYPRENGAKSGAYRIYNGQELLELSLVSIPANPKALMTSKSLSDAVEAKVIDEIEAKSIELWFEGLEEVEEETNEEKLQKANDKIANTMIENLKTKVEDLESKIEELTKEKEQKSYIDVLFEEYKSASGTPEGEPDADANDEEAFASTIIEDYID